jgi:hypothetical protein
VLISPRNLFHARPTHDGPSHKTLARLNLVQRGEGAGDIDFLPWTSEIWRLLLPLAGITSYFTTYLTTNTVYGCMPLTGGH